MNRLSGVLDGACQQHSMTLRGLFQAQGKPGKGLFKFHQASTGDLTDAGKAVFVTRLAGVANLVWIFQAEEYGDTPEDDNWEEHE
jgi:hypothetical protein